MGNFAICDTCGIRFERGITENDGKHHTVKKPQPNLEVGGKVFELPPIVVKCGTWIEVVREIK